MSAKDSSIEERTVMPKQLVAAIADFQKICDDSTTRSEAFKWGGSNYKASIRHFLASSSEVAQLAVQPGSTKDLCKMMAVLRKRRVPFAIMSGGHGMAPGFSSTTGIHISMARFDSIDYNKQTQELEIGSGCLWDQVYKELASYGRNVVGGAAKQGVGVGGWLLGGGYSLKSNACGLGIDNVIEFEIVTPDSQVRRVRDQGPDAELFQALRGGGNNFGIVTRFVLRTFPQGLNYGSSLVVAGNRAEEVKNAIVDFVEKETRKEAAIVAAFRHRLIGGKVEYNISILCVFDGEMPKRKKDMPFREFKSLAKNGETWKTDPAGWGRGRVEDDLERSEPVRQLKSPRRERRKNKSRPDDSGTMRSGRSFSGSRDTDSIRSGRSSPWSNADDSEDDFFDDGFEERTFRQWYGIKDTSSGSQEDSEDDDETFVDNPDFLTSSEEEYDEDEEFPRKRTWTPMPDYEVDQLHSRYMEKDNIDSMGDIPRGRFGCLMISKYTKPLLDKMAEEAQKSASYIKSHGGRQVVVDAWPVHPSIFDNSPPGAAWPHKRGEPYGPMLAYFQWEDAKQDQFWITKLKGTLNRIRVVARNLGLTPRKPALYNNLSLESVPVHKIYRENLDRLMRAKKRYDPTDVMGLAGGHKIELYKSKSKGDRGSKGDDGESD